MHDSTIGRGEGVRYVKKMTMVNQFLHQVGSLYEDISWVQRDLLRH